MPNYDYEYLTDDEKPTGEFFEYYQSMKDNALTEHPENGRKVRKCITPPKIASDLNYKNGKRIPGDFKEVMHKVHENTAGSTLNKWEHF